MYVHPSLIQDNTAGVKQWNWNWKGTSFHLISGLYPKTFYAGQASKQQNLADHYKDKAQTSAADAPALERQIADYQQRAAQQKKLAEETYALARKEADYMRQYMIRLDDMRDAQQEISRALDAHSNNNGTVLIWAATSRDASGRLSGDLVGNGLLTHRQYDTHTGQLGQIITGIDMDNPLRNLNYEYDALNNVTRRHDQVNGLREQYRYDGLDRLIGADIRSNSHTEDKAYHYDIRGNMTYKSDAGTMQYDAANRLIRLNRTDGSSSDYSYDANGNQVIGNQRRLEWNSFNKPARIANDKGVATHFRYGAGRQRILQINNLPGGAVETTIYGGKGYEEITTTDLQGNKKIEGKHYIYANGQVVAVHIRTLKNDEKQVDQFRYLHRDALNSIDTITDSSAQVVERLSYGPFGQRRNIDGSPLQSTTERLTNRGFTGHEHLDSLGLIHMNGRVYDAETGRFLSADPTMQFPYKTAGFNRYSYVQNNPLKYTDPSGYGLFSFIKKAHGISKKYSPGHQGSRLASKVHFSIHKNIAQRLPGTMAIDNYVASHQWAQVAVTAVATFYGGAYGASAASAHITYIQTGDSDAALKAAAITYATSLAFNYVGDLNLGYYSKAVAHGVVGGLSSKAQGGSFRSGFAAGAVGSASSALGDYGRYGNGVKRMVVGGTASVMGGGKFANGAITAAYGYVFNDLAHAQQNQYAITDAERQHVADGNIQGFWESRLAAGDPVARAGLASLNPSGGPIDYLFGGSSINNRLQAFANVYADGALNIDQVRVDLANVHIEAVTLDRSGVHGLLDPGQIAEYHHAVFERHSLPPTAFGGTPFTGAVREAHFTRPVWCGGCDW